MAVSVDPVDPVAAETLVSLLKRLRRVEVDLSQSNERTAKAISAIQGPFGVEGSTGAPLPKGGLMGELSEVLGLIERQVATAMTNGTVLSHIVGNDDPSKGRFNTNTVGFNQAALGALDAQRFA